MAKISMILSLLLLFAVAVIGQNRTITGTVVDQKGDPVSFASVKVKGSNAGVAADAEGKFSILAKTGDILVVSATGIAETEVAIGSGNTVTITVERTESSLTEVVVTALGIKREKKALGFSVATVSSKDLEQRTEGDIARVLNGKAPGVDILNTSGLSGSGTNITIRGISTITGTDVSPLFVVDGVPFDGGTNNQSTFLLGNQTSSRFLDLDPNNIESVSILKGLSATTLYGDQGRNGVILITTKNGAGARTNKKMEVTLTQSFFLNQVSNLPDYQDTYGGGFNQAPSLAFSNWGARFNNPPDSFAHPYSRGALNVAFPEYVGAKYAYQPYNSVKNFFRTGLVQNTSVNLASNSKAGSFSASYSYLDDQGFTPGNSLNKNNFGLGGTLTLQNNITLSATLNYVITDFKTPSIGSSGGSSADAGFSVFGDLIYTPRSIDLLGWPFENPLDGSSVYYRADNGIQNPRWTVKNSTIEQKAYRTFGNFQVKYNVMKGVSIAYRIGVDQYNEDHYTRFNKGGKIGNGSYTVLETGAYRTINASNQIIDHAIIANFNRKITQDISLTVDAGWNYDEVNYTQSGLFSTGQLGFNLFDHSNFSTHDTKDIEGFDLDFKTKEARVGYFAQTSLGYRDFVFVNLGGRYSQTSTLESKNNGLFYPSVSASFIPTSVIEALRTSNAINYLKIRAGYATSARFPAPYRTRSSLNITTNAFVTKTGTIVNTNSIPDAAPNPELKPELLKEVETGIEAKLFDTRINLDLTFYYRTSTDQILDRQLDPSTGYSQTTINAGSVDNKGIEVGLGYNVIRNKNWNLQLDGNFTLNRNKVRDLPDDIKLIPLSGFSNLGPVAVNNKPLGVLQGAGIARDSKTGMFLVDNQGWYVSTTDPIIIGDPNPDYKLTGIGSLSYKSLSFRMQWDFTKGGDLYSGTVRSLLARGLTKDTDFDRDLPLILPNSLKQKDSSPNDIQTSATNLFFNNYGFGPSEVSVYDATVVRLREVSLSYSLPASVLSKTPFGSLSISIIGQNLWYNAPNFPKYTNFDPETTSLVLGGASKGLERLTGPSARRFGASVKVSF